MYVYLTLQFGWLVSFNVSMRKKFILSYNYCVTYNIRKNGSSKGMLAMYFIYILIVRRIVGIKLQKIFLIEYNFLKYFYQSFIEIRIILQLQNRIKKNDLE